MTTHDLCTRYLNALNDGDLTATLALFTPSAQVSSPLYGQRDAQSFYADLFADTARSETRLLNVFDQSTSGSAVALHFEYDWTLSDGTLVQFECVDVFQRSANRQQFDNLTIIYDTAHLRASFAESTR